MTRESALARRLVGAGRWGSGQEEGGESCIITPTVMGASWCWVGGACMLLVQELAERDEVSPTSFA